jgi:hypothetical protein
MRRLVSRKGLYVLALLLGLAPAAWFGWKPAWAWYCLHRLVEADEATREEWAERVAALDGDALPGLLDCLAQGDARVCANAEAALAALARAWGPGDARTQILARQLYERWPALSGPGQEAALEWLIVTLQGPSLKAPLSGPWAKVADQFLTTAARAGGNDVRVRALALADVLLEKRDAGPWLKLCRELMVAGLKAPGPELRVRAVHLALHAHFREDVELLGKVVPLLGDPDAAVRRAAVLALGQARAVISEEGLLPLLHDGDADVRRLCETALRSRGLSDEHLLLGRLISDSRAAARLQVVRCLEQVEVEPGVWLRRLSADPSPAVRAGAIRAAAQSDADLGDVLRQMAERDSSPTVRQLAQHYLKRP